MKPLLRRMGSTWRCSSRHDTPKVMYVVTGYGQTAEEAYLDWRSKWQAL